MGRNWVLKPIVWTVCLIPLAMILFGVETGTLGANPVEGIAHRTGLTALILLLLTLSNSPLRRWTGLSWLIQYRRLGGLFAFFYATLHLFAYLWLDQNFSVASMTRDIIKRPFVPLGAVAWVSLFPLVLTSTKSSIRILGRNWVRLHRLIYVAAMSAMVHFLWAANDHRLQALFYLGVLTILLGWRVVGRVANDKHQNTMAPQKAPQIR